ncbi:CBS domain-containing protein [Fundidesulfovibrio butyratiphilus]
MHEKTFHDTAFFFSALLGRPVILASGRPLGALWDVQVELGDVFPVVSRLVVRSGRTLHAVRWDEVTLFNPFVISLAEQRFKPDPFTPGDDEIFMRRDILDKQIVDIDGARLVRVNDLKIERVRDRMCLVSVDVGLRGVARRLGQERLWGWVARLLGRQLSHTEISWQFVQHLEMNLSRLTLTVARDKLEDMHPADIAQIISQIPVQSAQAVLSSMGLDTAGEALKELDPEVGGRVLSQLEVEYASDLLEEMDPDEAADMLAELPEEKSKELLERMDAEDAEKVQELLEHEEDTAGGLMNNEFVQVGPDSTAGQAVEAVRRCCDEFDMVYYVYVLDEEERLLGVATLRELLAAEPHLPVTEIMRTKVKSVDTDSEPFDVLELVDKYKLLAVPVLDQEQRMVGIVSSEDVLRLFMPYAIKWKRASGARTF